MSTATQELKTFADLDEDVSDLINRRVLVQGASAHLVCDTCDERTILEVSPSGDWVKIGHKGSPCVWFETSRFQFVELLPEAKSHHLIPSFVHAADVAGLVDRDFLVDTDTRQEPPEDGELCDGRR